jgi:septin family protein
MENQRVSISYTIELEELPQETERLYEKFWKLAENLSDLKPKEEESLFSVESLTQIDQARKRLARMDFMLSDVANIIQSYMEHQVSQNQSQQPQKTSEDTQEVSAQGAPDINTLFSDLSEINEKLTEAKKRVSEDALPS